MGAGKRALRAVFTAALTVVVLGAWAAHGPPLAKADPPSNAFRFVHDEDGRLEAAIDPEGDTALYDWDAAGNLLSISRHASSQLAVIQLEPPRGEVGSTVVIKGTGFSSTPAANTVKFNGTAATVEAATPWSLEVKVPSGATTGAVTVATSGEPVTSPGSFTVTASSKPSISSLSPAIVAAGEEVTIAGSNFESSALDNVVAFNGIRPKIVSATASSLKFKVPPDRLGGQTSVLTPNGSVAGPDLFLPPGGAAPAKVSATGRVSLNSSKTVTIGAPGTYGLLLVDGTAGQRISVLPSEANFSGTVRLFRPTGAELGFGGTFSSSSVNLLGPTTLPETGTYTIRVEGSGEQTGSVKLSAYTVEDVNDSIVPTEEGANKSVTLNAPGQDANYSVSVEAGDVVSVKTSEADMSAEYCLRWLNPEGGWMSSKCWAWKGSGFWGRQKFTSAGTYKLKVDPTGPVTGKVSLTLWDAPDLTGNTITPTTEGQSKSFSVNVPGQFNLITFEGKSGDDVTLKPAEATFSGSFKVLRPSGATVSGSTGNLTSVHGPFDLPETGTYTIQLEGSGEGIGSVKLSAYLSPFASLYSPAGVIGKLVGFAPAEGNPFHRGLLTRIFHRLASRGLLSRKGP